MTTYIFSYMYFHSDYRSSCRLYDHLHFHILHIIAQIIGHMSEQIIAHPKRQPSSKFYYTITTNLLDFAPGFQKYMTHGVRP